MPFTMKIQPIDSHARPQDSAASRFESPVKAKSRLKRWLFDRQFTRTLAAEKVAGAAEEAPHFNRDGGEFEPSSMCLAKMVQSFIESESNNEKQQSSAARCSRNRCNCFNGNCDDSSDDESEFFGGFCDSNRSSSSGETCELLKSLVTCSSLCERNLLADTAKIVEKNKTSKRKDDNGRAVVTENLLALGYEASICKSRWENSPSYPSGEYEYIDVIVKGERLLVDVDFRSEFEIARPTKSYKAILQTLPYIFVGRPERLRRIVGIVSEAAKQSLKKKGMHVPPWRKAEYVKAKWLSPHIRAVSPISSLPEKIETVSLIKAGESDSSVDCGELEETVFEFSESEEEWKPPEIKPKISSGVKIVTGLASVMEDEDDDES